MTRILRIHFLFTLFSPLLHGQIFTTKGTVFWLGFMENYQIADVTVYVSSDVATSGTVAIPAQGWSQNFTVVPGVTAAITIPSGMAEASGSGNIEPKGIQVIANDSVHVFALNYVPYTSDAAVILPIQTIGNSYRAFAYKDNQAPYSGYSEILIVACYPNTVVEITPSAATVNGNPANVPFQITLNAGQVYQLQSAGDLSGTLVRGIDSGNGCPNFALFAGNQCTGVQCAYCDHLYEQMYPIHTWGTQYVLVPLRTRTSDRYRIIASVNGTQVSINGAPPVVLNAGQVHQFDTGTASFVQASNPIQVAQYSKGGDCDNTNSDPFMIMLSPVEQTLKYITFNAFTSTIITYYYLNIVTRSAHTGLIKLDGVNIGAQFVPVPSNPAFSYAQLLITQGNHTLQSDSGFVAYVYGYGNYESYGYPVGANLTNLYAGFTYAPVDTTLDTTYICPFTLLRFTARGDTTVSSYEWDFGDGNTAMGRSVFHAYQQFGTYEVKMMVTRPNACGKDTLKSIIRVTGPRPHLVADDTICRGTSFTITAANANYYFWNTGATTQSITVSPTTTTTYWVQVQDTQCIGEPDSITIHVIAPHPDFTFTEVCEGGTVSFINQSNVTLDTVVSWSWSFGDNATSSQFSPTHTYGSGGIFNVTLGMLTSQGCTATLTKSLINHPAPIAALSAPNVCHGDIIQFIDNSSVFIDTIQWRSWAFGDGNTSSLPSPVHSYADSGIYQVRLVVASSFGCLDTAFAQVAVFYTPVADFTASSVCLGTPVVFQNNSSAGSGINYEWDFGDGTLSTQSAPAHTYVTVGEYQVQLIVRTGDGCSDTTTRQISVYPVPHPSFSYAHVCDGMPVSFTNTSVISQGTLSSYWVMGDGTASTQTHPIHLYADSGGYAVKLVVTSDQGCADSVTQIVQVYFQPQADFQAPAVCWGLPVSFSNMSSVPSGVEYRWNFGDGTFDFSSSPMHYYSVAGLYPVKLTVITPQGCTDSIVKQVVIYPLPQPRFEAADVCLGNSTTFTNQSTIQSGTIQTVAWLFGDGGASSQFLPIYYYSQPGSYTVQLKLTSDAGCMDSTSQVVTVYPVPTASTSSTTACYNEDNATATVYPSGGTPPYFVTWSDGQTTATAVNLFAGIYSVTVVDGHQCSVSVSEYVQEQPFPVVLQVTPAVDTLLFGDTVKTVSVTGNYDPYLIYRWQPPTGLGCDSCMHTFASPLQTTTYTITAADTLGCTGQVQLQIVVLSDRIIYIPNAFTPDGNGVNDVFKIYAKGVKRIEFRVFDRWGEKVFESTDLERGWDGHFKGYALPPAVYTYTAFLEFLDGYQARRKGSVTLIR